MNRINEAAKEQDVEQALQANREAVEKAVEKIQATSATFFKNSLTSH